MIDTILKDAIPMSGRMIHGKDALGNLWEAAQAYDVHGRVRAATTQDSLSSMLT
jgi:kynurenine 3-monooxygenase